MSDIAIKFENISKQYRLGSIGTGTLSHDLKRWWIVNVRGKEDPYLKIGQINDRSAKANGEYVWALKDINLEVKQGEVLGIIGKNGAGKSTLLKILSRVTTPTTGSIKAKGRIASLLEVGTGFHPEMTGMENIYMNGSILGMTKLEITRKMDEIVDFAGVEKYIDTPVKRYSSGMMVRLGFAIAAHLEPEILVVDEVLAVGDAEFQKKAIGKMQDVSQGQGRTVLFVSHNMSSILRLCKRGILLNCGSIITDNDIERVVNKYLEIKSTNKILSPHGIGGIKVSNVIFNNNTGQDVDYISTFEDLIIDMHCEALEQINEVTFAVCFNNIYDLRVTSLWTKYKAESYDIKKGKFVVSFSINKMKLIPGDYEIVTYIETNNREIEQIFNFKRITVKYTNAFGITVEPTSSQGQYIEDFNTELYTS